MDRGIRNTNWGAITVGQRWCHEGLGLGVPVRPRREGRVWRTTQRRKQPPSGTQQVPWVRRGRSSEWPGCEAEGQPAGWAWESVKRGGLPWWLSSKQHASQRSRRGSTPGLGRCPGEGNGNPHQYSCLKNPMDRGAWQATVHGNSNSRRAEHDLATEVKWRSLSSVRLLATPWDSMGFSRPEYWSG